MLGRFAHRLQTKVVAARHASTFKALQVHFDKETKTATRTLEE